MAAAESSEPANSKQIRFSLDTPILIKNIEDQDATVNTMNLAVLPA